MSTTLVATEKVDIALVEGDDGILDIEIASDGDFVCTGGFDTAIINDLQSELRASSDEQPDAMRRGGWIGNETPDTQNYQVGSKLYFYYRVRNILKNKNASVDAVKDSLSKYVPKYLKEVEVTGELTTSGIKINTVLKRYGGKIDKLSFNLWELTG